MSRYMRQDKTIGAGSRSKTPVFNKNTNNRGESQDKQKLWAEIAKPIRYNRDKNRNKSSNFIAQNPNKLTRISNKVQLENANKNDRAISAKPLQDKNKKNQIEPEKKLDNPKRSSVTRNDTNNYNSISTVTNKSKDEIRATLSNITNRLYSDVTNRQIRNKKAEDTFYSSMFKTNYVSKKSELMLTNKQNKEIETKQLMRKLKQISDQNVVRQFEGLNKITLSNSMAKTFLQFKSSIIKNDETTIKNTSLEESREEHFLILVENSECNSDRNLKMETAEFELKKIKEED